MNKSIILLSGGLDSLVALAYCQKHTDYNIDLALTFDYGQKAINEEINASKKIADFYNTTIDELLKEPKDDIPEIQSAQKNLPKKRLIICLCACLVSSAVCC